MTDADTFVMNQSLPVSSKFGSCVAQRQAAQVMAHTNSLPDADARTALWAAVALSWTGQLATLVTRSPTLCSLNNTLPHTHTLHPTGHSSHPLSSARQHAGAGLASRPPARCYCSDNMLQPAQFRQPDFQEHRLDAAAPCRRVARRAELQRIH